MGRNIVQSRITRDFFQQQHFILFLFFILDLILAFVLLDLLHLWKPCLKWVIMKSFSLIVCIRKWVSWRQLSGLYYTHPNRSFFLFISALLMEPVCLRLQTGFLSSFSLSCCLLYSVAPHLEPVFAHFPILTLSVSIPSLTPTLLPRLLATAYVSSPPSQSLSRPQAKPLFLSQHLGSQ